MRTPLGLKNAVVSLDKEIVELSTRTAKEFKFVKKLLNDNEKNLQDLETSNKDSIVDSINELVAELKNVKNIIDNSNDEHIVFNTLPTLP